MEKVLVFGTGKRAVRVINYIEKSEHKLLALVDNDKKKQGTYYGIYPIIAPTRINEYPYDKIIICSVFFNEIYGQLIKLFNISKEKIEDYTYFTKKNLLNYYENHSFVLKKDMRDSLEYIKEKGLGVFNDIFIEKYHVFDISVSYDNERNMFFVMHNNKRMYMSREYNTVQKVKEYYRSIIIEQDKCSPHRYLDDTIQVENGDVVIDAGVAEGNFALEIIDRVKKLYLVEIDENWIEALKNTFEPYKEKVEIINKYLGSDSKDNHITIDDIAKNKEINFIKMDIEGAEVSALEGAKECLINNSNIKLDICSYHNHNDEKIIREFLERYGFCTWTTNGYMVFMTSTVEPKKLVRGLVRGSKSNC